MQTPEATRVYDYTTAQLGQGIELIVRPNNRYGSAQAGEKVLVDPSELRNPSTMSSCMTIRESEEIEAEKKAKAKAASEKKDRSSVKAMVDRGLDALAALASAKAKARDEAEEAEEEAQVAQAVEKYEEKARNRRKDRRRLTPEAIKAEQDALESAEE